LSPALKATVCAVIPSNVASVLCPPGSPSSNAKPAPLPDLGTIPGLGSGSSNSSSGSSSSGSGGGLGGLLGGLGGGGN
jgi:hypothetical protein